MCASLGKGDRPIRDDALEMTPLTARPAGLASLCASVGFERAAYYGLQSVLALYLADILLSDRPIDAIWLLEDLSRLSGARGLALASLVAGLFGSLAAIAPVIGAVMADRVIGQHRAVMTGGMMMAAGHGLLIVEAAMLPALAVIAVGSGFFKGSIAAQLSGLYQPADPARAEGFRLFYIAINLAGLLAPLIIGTAAERIHWHAGFAIACLAMMIGLGIYRLNICLSSRPYLPERRRREEPAGVGHGDRITIAILGASVAMITVTNFQITNAYLLWADQAFARSIGGWSFPASWMIAIDGLISLCALGASGAFWAWVHRRSGAVPVATKAMVGGIGVVGGTVCLMMAAAIHGKAGVPVYWGLAFQCLNSLGLANVLPAVMAIFGQSSPRRFAATSMAGFYLSIFAGGLCSTALASQYASMPLLAFWSIHALCAATGAAGLGAVWLRSSSRDTGAKARQTLLHGAHDAA